MASRPHAIALMMLRNIRNNKTRLLVKIKSEKKAPYYWVNKNGTYKKLNPVEITELQRVFLDVGWMPPSAYQFEQAALLSSPRKWQVLDAFQCPDTGKVYRFGTKRFTHCDLILMLPGLAFQPDKWRTPLKILRRLSKQYWLPIVRTMERTYIAKKRFSYTFEDTRPSALKLNEVYNICSKKINKRYLHAKLKDPSLSAILAVRNPDPCRTPPKCHWVPSTGLCVTPTAWMVWNRLRRTGSPDIPAEYNDFKQQIESIPSVSDRHTRLCQMLERTRPKKIGGICLYDESRYTVRVMILCSDRSVGGRLLEEIIRRFSHKTLYIDHPLPEVIPFYSKYGFRFQDPGDPNTMVYTRQQQQQQKQQQQSIASSALSSVRSMSRSKSKSKPRQTQRELSQDSFINQFSPAEWQRLDEVILPFPSQ